MHQARLQTDVLKRVLSEDTLLFPPIDSSHKQRFNAPYKTFSIDVWMA